MNSRKRKCSSLGLLYRRELLPGFAAVSTFPCFFLLAFQRERESSHVSDCERASAVLIETAAAAATASAAEGGQLMQQLRGGALPLVFIVFPDVFVRRDLVR